MSENDMIAEFIKEQYPELLDTFEFAIFRIQKHVEKMAKSIAEGIKAMNFSDLKKVLEKVNESSVIYISDEKEQDAMEKH